MACIVAVRAPVTFLAVNERPAVGLGPSDSRNGGALAPPSGAVTSAVPSASGPPVTEPDA